MADQAIPTMLPNSTVTTDGPIPADRQPANTQEIHPSKGPNDSVPQVRHADDHDSEAASRAGEEK